MSASPVAAESPAYEVPPDEIPDVATDKASIDKSWNRLQFLLKQSTVYASILSEKMQKQQEQQRKADEKKAALQTADANKGTGDSKSEDTTSTKPATKRGRPARKVAKKQTPLISDLLSKEELQKSTQGASTAEILASTTTGEGESKLGAQNLKSARQPALLTGAVMKGYQLEGLDWLVSLYENGLNGILADEMGLGKTIQTISLLAFLREKGIYGPFLVAAPVSTLSNWVDEIHKFTPEMPVLLYHGTPTERAEKRAKYLKKLDQSYPVVCTSYEIIMNDSKFLQKIQWKFIIIDEGHRLKNLNCKLIRELKTYSSANRLLLTGTPLQNNLSELWSLLNFLLPDIFDDLDAFQGWFDFSALQEKEGHKALLEQDRQSHIISSLHAILKPFLLRRIKTDVETSLPPKREYILYAPLTQEQKDLYTALLDRRGREYVTEKILEIRGQGLKPGQALKRKADQLTVPTPNRRIKKQRSYKELTDAEYFKTIESEPQSEEEIVEEDIFDRHVKQANKLANAKKFQNLIMQLRLTCDHPYLFYWPWMASDGEEDPLPDQKLVTASGKMALLDRLVPELLERGHKVLIFSQFSSQLDILHDWATVLRGLHVCRIDGSTSQDDRRLQIKAFSTDPEISLFLLSTRAGGQGINLVAADTVILFDSDWNPQQDLQAQDRAHRIGQTRPVLVFRLATANTVEQTLLEKADAKRRLEKLVIKKGAFKSLLKGEGDKSAHPDDELREILLREDFEKVDVLSEGQEILPKEELDVLLDRSPEAYERAEKGLQAAGKSFRVVDASKAKDEETL